MNRVQQRWCTLALGVTVLAAWGCTSEAADEVGTDRGAVVAPTSTVTSVAASGRARWEAVCTGLTFANDEVGAWPASAALDATPGLGGRIASCRFSWGKNEVEVSVGDPEQLEALVDGPADAAAYAAAGSVTFEASDLDHGTPIDLMSWGRGRRIAVKLYVSGDTVDPDEVAAVFDAAIAR